MAVPNGAKRRQNNERSKMKRFKPNEKPGSYGRFGPPAMMRDAFGPGPFPAMRPGPGPCRYPPGPMFGPPMGFMGPPDFRPRLRGPMRPPRPHMPPPPFMQRPPFHREFPPFPRPMMSRPNMRSVGFHNRNMVAKPPNNTLDEANDLNKPWVTEQIRAECYRRQQLVRTARQSRKDTDWEEVKASKRLTFAMMKEAKERYMNRYHEPFQGNSDTTDKAVDFAEDLKF